MHTFLQENHSNLAWNSMHAQPWKARLSLATCDTRIVNCIPASFTLSLACGSGLLRSRHDKGQVGVGWGGALIYSMALAHQEWHTNTGTHTHWTKGYQKERWGGVGGWVGVGCWGSLAFSFKEWHANTSTQQVEQGVGRGDSTSTTMSPCMTLVTSGKRPKLELQATQHGDESDGPPSLKKPTWNLNNVITKRSAPWRVIRSFTWNPNGF